MMKFLSKAQLEIIHRVLSEKIITTENQFPQLNPAEEAEMNETDYKNYLTTRGELGALLFVKASVEWELKELE